MDNSTNHSILVDVSPLDAIGNIVFNSWPFYIYTGWILPCKTWKSGKLFWSWNIRRNLSLKIWKNCSVTMGKVIYVFRFTVASNYWYLPCIITLCWYGKINFGKLLGENSDYIYIFFVKISGNTVWGKMHLLEEKLHLLHLLVKRKLYTISIIIITINRANKNVNIIWLYT